MLDKAAVDGILGHYPHAGAWERWHMRGRLRLCPYDALLPHFTGNGNVLDVGCGFGHLAWYLAQHRPELRYAGTDIDPRKIALAQGSLETAPGPVRPEFHLGDVLTLSGLPAAFGNIVLLDVLYLMPWEAQRRLLGWCFDHLAPGEASAVVVKTMDPARGFPGFRAVAEEWIMVRLLRRTLDSGALNGAAPLEDYRAFALSQGFACDLTPLGTFNPSSVLRFHR